MEREQSAQELVDALQALLDNERIEHSVSAGIAKQIIAQRSLEGLSDRQLEVFEEYIKEQLEIPCEGHCGGRITLADIPGALANEFEDGGLYCQHCCYDIRK
jgi:hypothetical protein